MGSKKTYGPVEDPMLVLMLSPLRAISPKVVDIREEVIDIRVEVCVTKKLVVERIEMVT
jgi:hypothetical protein